MDATLPFHKKKQQQLCQALHSPDSPQENSQRGQGRATHGKPSLSPQETKVLTRKKFLRNFGWQILVGNSLLVTKIFSPTHAFRVIQRFVQFITLGAVS